MENVPSVMVAETHSLFHTRCAFSLISVSMIGDELALESLKNVKGDPCNIRVNVCNCSTGCTACPDE